MTSEELQQQLARLIRDLHDDFDGRVPLDRVARVSQAHFESLCRDAAINDFIPLLVHRYAKEELVGVTYDALHRAA